MWEDMEGGVVYWTVGFMLSSLPCFYAFCWSAIPTSSYILNVFYPCIHYNVGASYYTHHVIVAASTKIAYETSTLLNCHGHLNFPTSPIVPPNLSQEHQYTGPLKASNTYECPSLFFPHTSPCRTAYLRMHVYKTASHCILLNRLYFVTHLIPQLTLNP